MRIIGIDFGEKNIGIAISDPLRIIAQPLSVAHNIEEVAATIKEYPEAQKIVVGLPKSLRGDIGIQAQKVLAFVEELKNYTAIPIVTWDERMTTLAAQRSMIAAGLSRKERKTKIDKSAAALILQSYLDGIRKPSSP